MLLPGCSLISGRFSVHTMIKVGKWEGEGGNISTMGPKEVTINSNNVIFVSFSTQKSTSCQYRRYSGPEMFYCIS